MASEIEGKGEDFNAELNLPNPCQLHEEMIAHTQKNEIDKNKGSKMILG